MGIRPENIDDSEDFLLAHKNSILEAKVEVTELMGAETYIYMSKEKSNIVARVNGTSKAKTDDIIKIAFDNNKIHIFDKDTEITVI